MKLDATNSKNSRGRIGGLLDARAAVRGAALLHFSSLLDIMEPICNFRGINLELLDHVLALLESRDLLAWALEWPLVRCSLRASRGSASFPLLLTQAQPLICFWLKGEVPVSAFEAASSLVSSFVPGSSPAL